MTFRLLKFGAVCLAVAGTCFTACSDDEACADANCGGGDTTSVSSSQASSSQLSSSTGLGGAGGQESLTATVVVVDIAGEPLATNVIVNAADGSIVTETMSDASGEVVVAIPAGGSVSAYYSYSGSLQQTPYEFNVGQSAFPGDTEPSRILLQPSIVGTGTELGTSTMNVQTTFPMKPSAASYQLLTNCSAAAGAPPGVDLTMGGCTNDGMYDLVVAAHDFYGELMDYRAVINQPFAPGGSASHNFVWTTEALAGVPYQVELPANAGTVSLVAITRQDTHGVPFEIRSLVPHNGATGMVRGSVSQAVAFGTEYCVLASIRAGDHWRNKERCSSTPNLATLQFDATRLATFAPAGLGWQTAQDGDLGDELQVVTWALEGNVWTQWTARVVPFSQGALVRPVVPSSLSQYMTSQEEISIRHIDFQTATGFAEALEAPDYSAYELNFSN